MKTVVALYVNSTKSHNAAQALVDAGFPADQVSVTSHAGAGDLAQIVDDPAQVDLADRDVESDGDGVGTGAGVGAVLGGLAGLLVGIGALTIPGIGPVVAAGSLAAALAGAGVGAVAGGMVGALIDLGVPENDASTYAEGIRRGGSIVVVQTEDERAARAAEILHEHAPVDLEAVEVAWREEGWEGFDETAEPILAENFATRERETHGIYDSPELSEELREQTTGVEATAPVTKDQYAAPRGVRIYEHER